MLEILPRLHFVVFRREGCGLSHVSVPRIQRRFGFVLKPGLVGYFAWSRDIWKFLYFPGLNSIFHLLVQPRGYFLPLFGTPSRFRPHTWTTDEAAATTLPLRPLCIPEAITTRTIYYLRRSFRQVFMMHSALLQHSRSRSLTLSFTSPSLSWPITPFYVPASFPTCALKSPTKIVDSLVSAFLTASLVSFRNSGYCALTFGPYTSVKHRDWSNNFSPNICTPFLLVGLYRGTPWKQTLRFLYAHARNPSKIADVVKTVPKT